MKDIIELIRIKPCQCIESLLGTKSIVIRQVSKNNCFPIHFSGDFYESFFTFYSDLIVFVLFQLVLCFIGVRIEISRFIGGFFRFLFMYVQVFNGDSV